MPPTTTLSGRTTISPIASLQKSLGFLLFLFGWTATLATVLGFLGSRWWPLDVLTDWRLLLFVVLVIATISSGLGYSRISAVVFLVAAIINALLIAPLWLDEQPPVSSNDRLRVVSLDIGLRSDVRAEVMEWVNMIEGDIVVLANSGGFWDRAIEDLGVPYRVVNEDPGLTGGTLVLARNDLPVKVEELRGRLGAVDIAVSVTLADREVTILGYSTERPVSTRGSSERLEEFTAVNAGIHQQSGPTIIVGNFETSRWSHAFGILSNGLTNSENGFGYLATYPSFDWPFFGDYLGIPVDHALYQGPITVSHRRVSPSLGTSHRALVVDVSPADG